MAELRVYTGREFKYHNWSGVEVHSFSTRPATNSEISEAHPKCGTCALYGLNNPPNGWNECINPLSPYAPTHDGLINPALDYCRHHSELTTEGGV